MLAGEPPAGEFSFPAGVRAAAGAEPIKPVWLNEAGGWTFQIGSGAGRTFVKWSPPAGIDLRVESRKLRWAARYVAVPIVLRTGSDTEAVGSDTEDSWMITAGLPGENAVTDRWKADPARAVAAIGRGLREMHDALPVRDCPFTWSQPDRTSLAHRRAGLLDPIKWHQEHRHLTVAEALAVLADPPPVDRLVVCHGDACAPNTLIADDGTCSGRVDLGALGLADRWADLAIATWSTNWNYGPGWESALLDAYGIDPDPVRTAYYRLLWDLGP